MAFFKAPKTGPMDLDRAEAIALSALAFLAEDPGRLGRFLALTGIGPDELRAGASKPVLQAAVLDHMLQDESLLLMFSQNASVPPENLAAAHHLLTNAACN